MFDLHGSSVSLPIRWTIYLFELMSLLSYIRLLVAQLQFLLFFAFATIVPFCL